MRVAIISDIHGNLVALDAVLAELAAAPVDQVVCLGDVAASGPQPRESVERLRGLGCPVVMDNADAWLLDPRVDGTEDADSRRYAEIDAWCARQLSAEDLTYIRGFQPAVRLPLQEAQDLLCYHGAPGSYDEIILPTTPEDEVERMLRGQRATVMAGGHTHVQMLRRHGETLLLNPGSVGLPFERLPGGAVRNPPWAEYAVVRCGAQSLGMELRRAPVEVSQVVRSALASGMPHAEWWAQDWVVG